METFFLVTFTEYCYCHYKSQRMYYDAGGDCRSLVMVMIGMRKRDALCVLVCSCGDTFVVPVPSCASASMTWRGLLCWSCDTLLYSNLFFVLCFWIFLPCHQPPASQHALLCSNQFYPSDLIRSMAGTISLYFHFLELFSSSFSSCGV